MAFAKILSSLASSLLKWSMTVCLSFSTSGSLTVALKALDLQVEVMY